MRGKTDLQGAEFEWTYAALEFGCVDVLAHHYFSEVGPPHCDGLLESTWPLESALVVQRSPKKRRCGQFSSEP